MLCRGPGESRASVLEPSQRQPGFFPGCGALNAELKTAGTALVPWLGFCQVTTTHFYSRLEFGVTKYFQTLLQVPRRTH